MSHDVTDTQGGNVRIFAADLIADDTFNIACVIACVLLIIAAVMAVLDGPGRSPCSPPDWQCSSSHG